MSKILPTINEPADLKKVPTNKLAQVAQEVRDELIEVCSKNGGHLGSNLGVTEITVALHHVFNSPQDKFIFDVSHQGYVHKMLTGRREYLHTLRQTDGCSGFLQREESAHDHFGAGHAGTAFSAALGLAAARDQKGTDDNVVAIVGDGAFGCGVSLEALNNVIETTDRLIVILNDNKMSISPNVGGLSKYLNRIITDKRYTNIKHGIGDLIAKIPSVGEKIRTSLGRVDEAVKSLVSPGALFEELGLKYYGPIDGHDIEGLVNIFNNVKDARKPVLLHILTEKGKGFDGANLDAEKCHGFKKVKDSQASEGLTITPKPTISFSDSFANSLCKLASTDQRIVGITAGMLSGTAMGKLKDIMPKRVYDVGIAEEHATVFAGGLAANGMRPVVAIYATFMQRAMDCVFHDICLQELPVIFCMDRAGLVEDGPTHHGIQDISFWKTMPNLTIMQPRDDQEIAEMMQLAAKLDIASVIRYAKTNSHNIETNKERTALELGKSEVLHDGSDAVIWASGRETETALAVADMLKDKFSVKVVNARFLLPFDSEALLADAATMPIISLEDHMAEAGMGGIITSELFGQTNNGLLKKGYPIEIITWGKVNDLRATYRMNTEQIAEDIEKMLQK